jgi:sugar phosphate isomerase/epimerase
MQQQIAAVIDGESMIHSRRGFGGLVLGTTATVVAASAFPYGRALAAEKIPTTFSGVQLGTCMYCYRDIPRGDDSHVYASAMVKQAAQSGAGLLEINAVYLEPKTDLPPTGMQRIQDALAPLRPGQSPPKWMTMEPADLQKQRDALRTWRARTPMSYFSDFRKEVEAAGLTPYSYVTTFLADMTDAELDSQFRQAAALGVSIISTNQTKVEMAPRLVAPADRYKIDVGWHNHTQNTNPNEVASVAVFERLFKLSPRMKANLDAGHFTAANNDAMEFIQRHADRITHIHMKDRKRNEGAGTPFGEGDAPLKELLLYVRDHKLSIGCIVEYEYPGKASGLVETQHCVEWMKRVLAS